MNLKEITCYEISPVSSFQTWTCTTVHFIVIPW